MVIIACWVIFWLYWFVSAFGSKKNTSPRLGQFLGIRFSVIVLALILFRLLNVQNYSAVNHALTNNAWVVLTGFVIFLAGLGIAVWARFYLGKNWGMPMTQKQDPELVTSGPYHYVRHPIYSGILLAMLGTGIASSSFWLIILIVTGIYFTYSAVVEEKLMAKQFPKVYPSYKSKTKMLIPFVF